MPQAEETALALNYAEYVMASWDPAYTPFFLEEENLQGLLERAESAPVPFADDDLMHKVKDYSFTLYAALMEYYRE